MMLFTTLILIILIYFLKIDLINDNLYLAYNFLLEFLQPDTDPEFLKKIFLANFETLSMSIVSTLISFLFGLFLLLTFNLRIKILNNLIMLILNLLRSIPDIIWAMIFLVIFGLGPLTGTIALTLHTTGIISKMYIETLQNLDVKEELYLEISGNNRTKIFFYKILPEVFSSLISFILYRWEYNIRASSVLGFVGAGGIGQLLYFHLSLFHFDKVSTIFSLIIINIIIVDSLSDRIRNEHKN